MNQISISDTIPVPGEVAICPICSAKLKVEISGAVENGDDWEVDEIHLSCTEEPDMDNVQEWRDHMDSHYSMPYVDWLPLEEPVLKWINENYQVES